MPCYKKHKMFMSYLCFSIQEGLLTEADQDQMRFGRYSKDLFRECEWCCKVFEITKTLKIIIIYVMGARDY